MDNNDDDEDDINNDNRNNNNNNDDDVNDDGDASFCHYTPDIINKDKNMFPVCRYTFLSMQSLLLIYLRYHFFLTELRNFFSL